MNAMDRAVLRYLVVAAVFVALVGADTPSDNGSKIVGEVVPVGNHLLTPERVLAHVRTRPGQTFNLTVAEEDVRRLKSSGAFANARVRTAPGPDGKLIVYFDVAELPNLIREIRYDGAKHLSDEELEKITGLRRGVSLNPMANRQAAQAIVRKYREDGRYWTSVNLKEGGTPGDTRVVFEITEGPVVRVSGTDFVGHGSWVSSARLRTQLQTSSHFLGIGGTFTPASVEFDVNRLEEYYRTLGYLDVRVTPELTWSTDHSRVKVTFHINEGPRYRIGKIEVVGNKAYKSEQLIKLTSLREEQIYDRNVIQADMNTIRDWYGYRGQRVAMRENYHQTAPGVVTVQYEVTEQPPARVGDIRLIGNTRTQDRVILRNIPLYPGQILTYPDIFAAESRLANLGIFEVNPETGVRPTVRVVDNEGVEKDIEVVVQETSTGSIMLGLSVNSDAGVTGNIVLNERNFDLFRFPRSLDDLLAGNAFRGGGQEFRLEAMPGSQFQRYTMSWREPSLFDSKFSLGNSLYYYTRNFLEYNERRVGTRVTLGRQLDRNWSVNSAFRVEGVSVMNVPFFAPDSILKDLGSDFLLGFRAGVTRDSRDSYLRPTTGSVFEASFEQVVGDHQFPLGSVEFTKYWTAYQRTDGSGKHVLAVRSQASFAGDNTPVYERYYAGGFRSMRGFSFRGVGPFENGFNVGGQFAFLNSVEYQIPVLASDKFFVVGFVDHGAVERKFEIQDYRVTAGFGFRIQTPLTGAVPIAIDFGFPIVKGADDRRQVFSFWLGFFNY